MLEAVAVALDPTPIQERALWSHAGAARFAYNAALAHVLEQLERHRKPEWSYYALRKWWNQAKDALAVNKETGVAWWRENSKEAYNTGLESLANGLRNWADSRKGRRKGRRVGFPRFKPKGGSVPRFAYTTGSYGLIAGDPNGLRLPRIGRVHCMENVTKRVGGAKVPRPGKAARPAAWRERGRRPRAEDVRDSLGRRRHRQSPLAATLHEEAQARAEGVEPQAERLQPPPQGT